MNKETKEKLHKEFGIHFKNNPNELQFLEAFIDDVLKEQREKCKEIIQVHLDYCLNHNGLPYCKNCGLSSDTLKLLDKLLD